MSPVALFAAGWLAGVLTVVFLAIIGLRASGDSVNDLTDKRADPAWADAEQTLFVRDGFNGNHGAQLDD